MTHWLKPAVLITNDFYSGLVTTWSETLQTLLCPARCQKNRIYAFVCAGTRKYTLLLCRLSTNPFHQSFQNGKQTTNKTQIAYYTVLVPNFSYALWLTLVFSALKAIATELQLKRGISVLICLSLVLSWSLSLP